MSNMDEEKKLQGDLSNGSAVGQEEKAGSLIMTIKRRLTCNKPKKEIIVILIVISHLICCSVFFFLGTLYHSKETIQGLPVTCPPEWVGHQGHCYYFSTEEKNWNESQNFCISHKAFLAKITKEEMAFVRLFTRVHVYWIGLKKELKHLWKWLDGQNSTLEVRGNGGGCAYLDDDEDAKASSGTCTNEHRFICKKNDPKGS